MKKVQIVCDGSSLGNGRSSAEAGAVAILIYRDEAGSCRYKAVGQYLGHATNNQAEIVAAVLGLEALKCPCEVEVITDSRYLVETQKGNFRQKANHEFWQRLHRAAQPHRVTWVWVRGHGAHPIQEQCDWAAKKIARRGRLGDTVFTDILEQAVSRAARAVCHRRLRP
jgi:ribonuclease HI